MVTSNPTIQRAGFLAATQASVKFSCPLHLDPVDLQAGNTPKQMLSFQDLKKLVEFDSYLKGADPT